ncbi:MAG: TatD family hydrolase [Marinilabiliales bacterium]|nr:TatD family hydrolase [Marinilabiliales bacterium]
MESQKPYINLHTHRKDCAEHTLNLFNCLIPEGVPEDQPLFSAGLHPWHADKISLEQLTTLLTTYASDPRFLAIGETGLDYQVAVQKELQIAVFMRQIELSRDLKFPLILHCVKAWEDLIRLTHQHTTPKILHGYNGSRELTIRLLDNGFYFSLGKQTMQGSSKFEKALSIIPLSRIFCETDDADLPIHLIYQQVAKLRGIPLPDLKEEIFSTFSHLFGKRHSQENITSHV